MALLTRFGVPHKGVPKGRSIPIRPPQEAGSSLLPSASLISCRRRGRQVHTFLPGQELSSRAERSRREAPGAASQALPGLAKGPSELGQNPQVLKLFFSRESEEPQKPPWTSSGPLAPPAQWLSRVSGGSLAGDAAREVEAEGPPACHPQSSVCACVSF